MIYCAARETLEVMTRGVKINGSEPTVNFLVKKQDVQAGWELVQMSIEIQKKFKVTRGFD